MTMTEGRRGIFKDIRVKGNKANETTEDSEDKKKTEVKLSMRHKRQKNPSIYPSIQFFPFQKKSTKRKTGRKKRPLNRELKLIGWERHIGKRQKTLRE